MSKKDLLKTLHIPEQKPKKEVINTNRVAKKSSLASKRGLPTHGNLI